MPQATISPLPSITSQAQAASGGGSDTNIFSPTTILNPLPQIVPGPTSEPPPTCSALTQWVNDNPVFAAGILVAGLLWATHKTKGR